MKYTDKQRAEIAQYAILHGNSKAAKKYSSMLKKKINERTVREFVKKFKTLRKNTPADTPIESLASLREGRPLLLGNVIDNALKRYIRKVRLNGGVVNRKIVIGAAKGSIKSKGKRSMLKEYGGSLELTRTFAQSFLRRIGFVKRKGTKAARKLPDDFPALKLRYLHRVAKCVGQHNVPPEMVVNIDQTGAPIVPVSNWTLAEEGSRQVPIVGKEDKRQITVLMGASAAGELLPPEVLYQGTTTQCHPNFDFPPEWDIHHTGNHWSNTGCMARYVDTILGPYMTKKREELGLPDDQQGLIILDVFKAHQVKEVIEAMHDKNMRTVFVPGCCTGELQPLDLSVNSRFKALMSESFTNWYADEVAEITGEDIDGDDLDQEVAPNKVDLRLTYLKPKSCQLVAEIHRHSRP